MKAGDVIFLDAGVVGMLAHPQGGDEPRRCRAWARGMIWGGVRLCMAEVTDYELRREMIRRDAKASLRRLDELRAGLDFAPITSDAMGIACHLWAESRKRGRPPAANTRLDCDIILAAQAIREAGPGREVVIASANRKHLDQFLDTRPWDMIELIGVDGIGEIGHSRPVGAAPGHTA